ncbi:hypothetical protein BDR26DRAFT_871053 [Obelidium mucronatum]|nr:hypothetical protein BDR26DRAFT_871053 [Obelidium mucronatum]
MPQLFIKTLEDARIVVESALSGNERQPLQVINPSTNQPVDIQSGTTIIFKDKTDRGAIVRWRDGRTWSPSRAQSDGFLLYREITRRKRVPTASKSINDFIPNGFVKRTCIIQASDSELYRVVNYYYTNSVAHHFENEIQPTTLSFPVLSRPIHMQEYQKFRQTSSKGDGVLTLPSLNTILSSINRAQSSETRLSSRIRKTGMKRSPSPFDWSQASTFLPPLRKPFKLRPDR